MGAGNEPENNNGYRVTQVYKDSPVSSLPIEPMLDFIIYSGEEDPHDPPFSFHEYIAKNENKEISLTFYNITTQHTWSAKVTPRRWGGKGLLGININKEDHTTAHIRVLRVLNFFVNSPLHKAGFRPITDYILGLENHSFKDLNEFADFIQEHNKEEIELCVYNSADFSVRTVKLIPDKDWGGTGYLGGDIGFGHLHSLPIREENTKEEKKVEKCQSEGKADEKSVNTEGKL